MILQVYILLKGWKVCLSCIDEGDDKIFSQLEYMA